VPIRQKRPDLNFPEAVETTLLKGMARSADDRHATAPEFAREFAEAAGPKDAPPRSDASLFGKIFGR
jgi:hypothetical protein